VQRRRRARRGRPLFISEKGEVGRRTLLHPPWWDHDQGEERVSQKKIEETRGGLLEERQSTRKRLPP